MGRHIWRAGQSRCDPPAGVLGGVEAIGRASARASENAHTLTTQLFSPVDAHNKAQCWRVELTVWAQDRHRSFCGSSQNTVASFWATPVQIMMNDGKEKCRRQGRKQGTYDGNSKHIAATCPRASTDAATCLNSKAGRVRFFTIHVVGPGGCCGAGGRVGAVQLEGGRKGLK